MSLSLPDEPDFGSHGSGLGDRFVNKVHQWKAAVHELIYRLRHFKILKITIVHWAVLCTWIFLLLHFTSVYKAIYQSSALVATMCTNVLLFGTSDCLAQSISCFLSYKIDPVPDVVNKVTRSLVAGLSLHRSESFDDNNSDNVSIFNDYGGQRPSLEQPIEARHSNLSHDWNRDSDFDYGADESAHELFSFYRWICFMFWGWFLSFFQVPWYKFLNYFYTEDPTVVQVLERVLSDQLVYSPISLYCFFMYSNYIMEHGDADSFQIKIKNIYITTLGCNYLVWPMVQFINFSMVPKHLQVPFSSSVGVLWNCFLSMRNSSNSI
ncbi:unnamed protein product [Kluyveromyces dobzhanskii CBS 2104]|uniref:WGS project CCBQ000000000 data, contig 00041 n=1 Tax=Kluyveromyces dobzhanskii CBS 2104 TaxID=1427455 RepID=A0A0A8L0K9_9SACH|nr:unnamed protein product [Kluyveromyces dobzhanskii CBS 2104]